MYKKIFQIAIIVSLLISCVPYKNIVYIQGNISDTEQSTKIYTVKKNDILYVNFETSNTNIQKLLEQSSISQNTQTINGQTLYFSGYTVDNKGFIDLPTVGLCMVEGKTYQQIKALIKQKLLTKQLNNVDDILIKVKLAGVPFSILGEVNIPQTSILYKENPTLLDAIAASGDISQVGDRKNIEIIRTENNIKQKISVDLTNANVINSPYFYVRPNDVIYVKPLRQKTLGTGTTLSQTISTTITALSLITSIILISQYSKN